MLTGYTHHFLAPLIKARLNLVHNTLDSDEDGDDGENDEDIVVAAIQDQLQNLSRYERAMPVEFAEEAALMISTYRSLNRPNGSGGEEVQVNLMDWTASFNNEVRKAWKEDVKNKETLRLKMPNQINQAHESMSKKINLQAVLDANEEVKQRMIKCRHDLKTHSPDFRIPDFAESRANAPVHGAPTPSPVQGIGGSVQKGQSIMSWNYTLPKSATGTQLQQLIGRRLGILEQTRWCPLCRMKVQEFRDGEWILCSSDLHTRVTHGKRGRNTSYPSCNGCGRKAPSKKQLKQEQDRRKREREKLQRKQIKKSKSRKKSKLDI
jgi:hypothetical protein